MTAKAGGTGHGGWAEFGNGHAAGGDAQVRNQDGGLCLSFSDIYDKGVDESGEDGEKNFINRQMRLNGDWPAGDAPSFRWILFAARAHYGYDAQDSLATDADTSVSDDRGLFGWRRENLLAERQEDGNRSGSAPCAGMPGRAPRRPQPRGRPAPRQQQRLHRL